jgi:hypothetical protein
MHPLPSVRRAAELAASLALVAASAHLAQGQTVGGQVVQLDSKKPLAGAAVALVNDSARVVASTAASNDGEFFLDAPGAGGYRVVLFVSGASFVSPSLQLDSGKTVERQFSVPNVPESFTTTLFARDVTTPATPLPGSPRPAYPASRLAKGERALVSTMFVVGENGLPDMTTFRVLSTTDADYVITVRDALHRTRFVPAQKDGAAVAQVVQYTYDFGLAGDPERGDVMIRPVAAQQSPVSEAPQKPPHDDAEKSVKKRYVIGTDELSSSLVDMLMLPEAMHRLRPALYPQAMVLSSSNPPEGPIFVNGVLVDGMSYLRHIPAKRAEEVRYLKREDAKIQYGMQYEYVILVKLRPEEP